LPEEYRDSKGRRMMSNVLVAYGHCSSNKERQHLEVVKAGDVIALSGTPAGSNTNDHLHYEVHLLQGDMNLPNPRAQNVVAQCL
jgi:murein DD-endopeptidase MepM/ murein hydrolase activator NlpD